MAYGGGLSHNQSQPEITQVLGLVDRDVDFTTEIAMRNQRPSASKIENEGCLIMKNSNSVQRMGSVALIHCLNRVGSYLG